MESDPEIYCLFLRQAAVSQPQLDEASRTLTFPGEECLLPGVLEKTLKGFGFVLANYTFDFLLRTNISSFFVFPLLKGVLATLPRIGCYAGVQGHAAFPFISGAGMCLSSDVVLLLSQNRDALNGMILDDLSIAQFLNSLHYKQIPLRRFDFVYERDTSQDSVAIAAAQAQQTYHFRIKNMYDRERFDAHYMKLLLKTYYGLEVDA
jgi:hypothetical protein